MQHQATGADFLPQFLFERDEYHFYCRLCRHQFEDHVIAKEPRWIGLECVTSGCWCYVRWTLG